MPFETSSIGDLYRRWRLLTKVVDSPGLNDFVSVNPIKNCDSSLVERLMLN